MSAGSNDSALMVDRDLGRLAPLFAQAVRDAIAECNAGPNGGLRAFVFEACRSAQLQALYYARGRTVKPPNAPVTNAASRLQSWHGFGLAVDVVHRDSFWNPPQGASWFKDVATIFRKHRCNWGGDWTSPDPPHFQWGRCTPSPTEGARTLLQTQGLQAVWSALGALAPQAVADATAAPLVPPS